jgi:hypothetical protein
VRTKNNLITKPVKTITIRCDCGRYVVVDNDTITCPDCGKVWKLMKYEMFEELVESVKEGAEMLRRKNDTK